MEIAASLLLFVAGAAQVGLPGQAPSSGATPGETVHVAASARILSGAEVRFERGQRDPEITSRTSPQIWRDSDDRLWIEFS